MLPMWSNLDPATVCKGHGASWIRSAQEILAKVKVSFLLPDMLPTTFPPWSLVLAAATGFSRCDFLLLLAGCFNM